jgi:cell division protein FtsQ
MALTRPEQPKSPRRAERRAQKAEARRFTRGSRRRRAAWVGVLGVVALLVVVLLVAIFSPILALRTIEVDGVSAIPASTVQKALAGQLGTPLALLNDQTIRARLSHIILIRSYVTEVVPPDTLVVRIVEREAIGVVPHGAGYDQVDPAGVVLRRSATPAGLPVIDIGRSGVNSAGFAAAVKVLLAMPSSVLTQVKSISATTLDNVSLTLDQGNYTILWGSSAQSDLKAQALTTLLKTCASQPVLNVTAPLALACGPAQKVPTPTPTPTSQP